MSFPMNRIRGLILLLAGILMAVVGAPYMYIDGKQKAENVTALRSEGKTIQAQVTDVVQKIRKSDKIEYSYTVGGQSYGQREDAPRELTDRLQPGAPIPVVYLPKDPSVATYDLEKLDRSAKNMTSFGPWLFAGIGILIAGVGAWRLRS